MALIKCPECGHEISNKSNQNKAIIQRIMTNLRTVIIICHGRAY